MCLCVREYMCEGTQMMEKGVRFLGDGVSATW